MSLTTDSFTDSNPTALNAHTPDVGNQWVQVVQVGTNALTVLGTVLGQNLNGASSGEMCKSQPSPSGVDYDVQVKMTAVDTGTGSSVIWRMHFRIQDSTNYYALRWHPTGAAANDCELLKCVAGTVTVLTSVDTGLAANDVFLCESRDNPKRVLKNGAEILTSSDNAITGAGDGGLSLGQLHAGDTGRPGSVFRLDDYDLAEVSGGTPAPAPAGSPWYQYAQQ